jgi:hypothetical protein
MNKKLFIIMLILSSNYILAQRTISANIYLYEKEYTGAKINYRLRSNQTDTISVIENQIKIKEKSVLDPSLIISGNYNTPDVYKDLVDIKLINIPNQENINLKPIYLLTKNYTPNGSCFEIRVKRFFFGLIKIRKTVGAVCTDKEGSFSELYNKEKKTIKFCDKDNIEIEYPVVNNQIIIDCSKNNLIAK